MSFLHRSAASRGRSQKRMSAIAVRDLRARLDRLGGAPRPRAQPPVARPRGFEPAPTPFGDAWLREDVIPLPALDPHPGPVAYIDTETTGLGGGAGTYVFAAPVALRIDCGPRVARRVPPPPGPPAAPLTRRGADLDPTRGL